MAVAFIVVVVSLLLLWLAIWLHRGDPSRKAFSFEEKFFVDPQDTLKQNRFPSVFDTASKYLSIVVPAYNEESRLAKMMDETVDYLKGRAKADPSFSWEIIIVDDGSRDRTSPKAMEYVASEGTDSVRLLTLVKNRGKGGAVRRGMMYTRGQYVMFADADGASHFPDFIKMETELKKVERDGLGVAVGSRAHMVDEAVATRKWYRNLLMHCFHLAVTLVGGVTNVRDTQCGFKLFTRRTAQRLFPNLHIERWAFDVELLYMANRMGIPIAEVAINWTEIDGSKLSPVEASIQMSKDLVRIRAAYLSRVWRIGETFRATEPSLEEEDGEGSKKKAQ